MFAILEQSIGYLNSFELCNLNPTTFYPKINLNRRKHQLARLPLRPRRNNLIINFHRSVHIRRNSSLETRVHLP
jgi:hypothetical protein